jgi:uncharacterized protein YdhG (YjbR/CyaY superfamily)
MKESSKTPGYETDQEEVEAFMATLEHPLKDEIEAVRQIIKKAGPKLCERIKWAAPSYYIGKTDLVTFNTRSEKKVLLVFHNIAIVDIASLLLEGTYKDRRLMYFNNMVEVKANKPELVRIIKEYIALAEKAGK